MKNKKGFTLMELLAIIVILGIIALIAAPNINKQISQNEKNESKILKNKIENASKLYAAKYYAKSLSDGQEITFTLNSLIDDGLINLDDSECFEERTKEIRFSNGKINNIIEFSCINK